MGWLLLFVIVGLAIYFKIRPDKWQSEVVDNLKELDKKFHDKINKGDK
jgi:preprotein translocase subunit YajC